MTKFFLKVFIYRGKEYERLSDFSSRMMNHLPNAELMNKLEPPGPEILESSSQCILFKIFFACGNVLWNNVSQSRLACFLLDIISIAFLL